MSLTAIAVCSMLLAGAPKTSADQEMDARPDGGIALTPMDQSDTDRDIKLTQNIRQELMKDDRLSFTSKNVKVITRAGEVTLRGMVPNKVERDIVRQLAGKIAGVKKVNDQLEFPGSNAPGNTN